MIWFQTFIFLSHGWPQIHWFYAKERFVIVFPKYKRNSLTSPRSARTSLISQKWSVMRRYLFQVCTWCISRTTNECLVVWKCFIFVYKMFWVVSVSLLLLGCSCKYIDYCRLYRASVWSWWNKNNVLFICVSVLKIEFWCSCRIIFHQWRDVFTTFTVKPPYIEHRSE